MVKIGYIEDFICIDLNKYSYYTINRYLQILESLKEESHPEFNFMNSTSDYASLYWHILEPGRYFESKIIRALAWIHDVLIRNRVGPSCIRNVEFFDKDFNGVLNHYEFKNFTIYLGLELNDYQLLWLTRCITPTVHAQNIQLKSLDTFVQYIDRPNFL